MAKITNLKQFRKQKARADKRQQSDENAARFGRSKAEKQLVTSMAKQSRHQLDQHRLEDD